MDISNFVARPDDLLVTAILAVRRLRQEDLEFEAGLS